MALLPPTRPELETKRGIFFEKVFMNNWIPFLHAILAILAAFIFILLDIRSEQVSRRYGKKRAFLRGKLRRAMAQSPRRGVA
jgi:hypothetical protein